MDFDYLPKKSIINKINVRNLFILSPVFLSIIFFNRYIFAESNLPYFVLIVVLSLILRVRFRLKKNMILNSFVISMIIFIMYSIFRIESNLFIDVSNNTKNNFYKFYHDIISLNIYLFLFVLGSILSFNKQKLSQIIWLLISVYVIMYVAKSLFSLGAIQSGAHLGAGDVLISLMPYMLLGLKDYKDRQKYANIILFILFVFLILIGARIASLSIIIMILMINTWPYVTRNIFIYNLVFFFILVSIGLLYLVYIGFMDHSGEALVSGSNIGALQKSTSTRLAIWVHLIALIQENIFWGYGSLNSTIEVSPVSYLSFEMNRDNLSSHSLYVELLYRLGIVGVFLFLSIMYSLWMLFWKSINLWDIRIAGSLIIVTLFYASSSVSLIFAVLELYWGFVWLFFGIAFGAVLRTKDTFRV
ncbi:O-antigen ligase family protein [Amylibacter sp.]|nr:O-antigen ligase family protein [Amylibacter sp.]